MSVDEVPRAVSISGSRILSLRSELLEDEVELHVVRIGFPPSKDAPLPAVYLLDGNPYTGMVAGAASMMALAQELPPHLLVGVGYPSDLDLLSRMRRRSFDLTPTRDAQWEQTNAEQGMDWKSGGGAQFLQALKHEFVPIVEAQFPADPERRALAGHSAGATFALYAMFEESEFFDSYVAASPSLWWDDRYTLRREGEFAGAHEDLVAKLFLSVGGLESTPRAELPVAEQEAVIADAMVGNLRTLAAALDARGYASLSLDAHVFEDETHTSVIPAAFSWGLRSVLGPVALTVSTEAEALQLGNEHP
jgi:hypothetical protein